jgi:hypothetical protein
MHWRDAPGRVRQAIEAQLGSPVVGETSEPGGFSPGMASRLRLADGRRVFAKAVSAELSPKTPDLYRQEISVASRLPATVRAPRLLWSYDDGDWVVPGLPTLRAYQQVLGRATLAWLDVRLGLAGRAGAERRRACPCAAAPAARVTSASTCASGRSHRASPPAGSAAPSRGASAA